VDIQTFLEMYFADTEAQQKAHTCIQRRAMNSQALGDITRRFTSAAMNLGAFRDEIEITLRRKGDDWGATGPAFLPGFHQLVKNHHDDAHNMQDYLRGLLTGLHPTNLGTRIEEFYLFLLSERARLRQAGKGNVAMAAGNSAFFLSLFTAWLNPQQQPDIYYLSMREGLYHLVKEHIVPAPTGLNLGWHAVEVNTSLEHAACFQLIAAIKSYAPEQSAAPFWMEAFGLWVHEYFNSQNKVTVEQGPESKLQGTPSSGQPAEKNQGNAAEQFLPNDPLLPATERVFSRLIREVQRHILVDEAVIRRVYHALLAGHVILSGPPGTGKTELARLIPEILWQRPEREEDEADPEDVVLMRSTAYTTSLVTATDEWSVRTLISGIAPVSKNGTVAYSVKYGYLTTAILQNWSAQGQVPEKWDTLVLRRSPVTTSSGITRGTRQTFRGQWLVIDEFNRAPIDLALGDALTALGGNDVLRVAVEGGSAELPVPRDFRIIGTLNSFDRHYLNQISEALKRRFSFIEILPPGRALRQAEQGIVLYKALEKVSHLSKSIVVENEAIMWDGISIQAEQEGQYSITWPEDKGAFPQVFAFAWQLFEIIRIYRQPGTAQAISLVRHLLIAGILQGYTTIQQWGNALDTALCDTLADQLQVLLPDEIDALLLVLTCTGDSFPAAYNGLLSMLADRPQRLSSQLLVLSRIVAEDGTLYLCDDDVEAIVNSKQPAVSSEKLSGLFHLARPDWRLPQFIRRLRAFKAERGL
jgi:hypothetical protein